MRDGTKTRQRLDRCALELFVKKGVSDTTIKDIAQETGIAEGTLYRHYESKEGLARHLFLSAYQTLSEQMHEIVRLHPTMDDKIVAMVHLFCKQYDDDPVLFHYLLLTQHSQVKHLKPNYESAHDFLVAVFEAAHKKNEIAQSDANFLAALTLGIVLQAALSRVYGRIDKSMGSDEKKLVKAVLGAIKAV